MYKIASTVNRTLSFIIEEFVSFLDREQRQKVFGVLVWHRPKTLGWSSQKKKKTELSEKNREME